MPHIPRAICVKCCVDMQTARIGIAVEMVAKWGSYYKIYTDWLKCPGCGFELALPAAQPVIEHYQPGYEEYSVAQQIYFYE